MSPKRDQHSSQRKISCGQHYGSARNTADGPPHRHEKISQVQVTATPFLPEIFSRRESCVPAPPQDRPIESLSSQQTPARSQDTPKAINVFPTSPASTKNPAFFPRFAMMFAIPGLPDPISEALFSLGKPCREFRCQETSAQITDYRTYNSQLPMVHVCTCPFHAISILYYLMLSRAISCWRRLSAVLHPRNTGHMQSQFCDKSAEGRSALLGALVHAGILQHLTEYLSDLLLQNTVDILRCDIRVLR